MLDLAEGSQGVFDTYVSFFDPEATATTAWVWLRHENGSIYGRGPRVGSAGLDDSHAARVAAATAPCNGRGLSRARAGRY